MMNNPCIEGCKRGAIDPVKLSYLKQCRWVKGDAKYLMTRMATMKKEKERNLSIESEKSVTFEKSSSCGSERPAFSTTDDEDFAHACKQKYLRSYTFTRKEATVAEKIKKLFKKKQNRKKKINDGSWSYVDACLKFLLLCVAKVDVHTEGSTSKTSA